MARQVMVVLALGLQSLQTLPAQERAPSDFTSATAAELLAEADRLNERGRLTGDVAVAIADRAVEFLGDSQWRRGADNQTILSLGAYAEPALARLTPDQKQQLLDATAKLDVAINGHRPEAVQLSYDWIKLRVALLHASGTPRQATQAVVEKWIADVGIKKISVEMTRWCLEQMLPRKVGRKEISVAFTGQLTPPRSGEYVFSVSPINVNKQRGPESVRHTISVSIGDTKVVDARPQQEDRTLGQQVRQQSEAATEDSWQWEGKPVDLQAGRPVPIQVDMNYQCSDPNPANSPAAILFWETTGMSRRPVPPGVLRQPDRQGQGLRAEYHWPEGQQNVTAIQEAPSIDFAWATPADVAPHHGQLVGELTEHLWELGTAADYLRQCSAGQATHVVFQDDISTQYFDTAKRQRFLDLLLQNRALLGQVSQQQLLRLYRKFRFGAEDEALDMVGQWMQIHADIAPEITADFFDENRRVFAELAEHLTRQLPGAYLALQEDYLEMPDRRCALPAAYTLSYSYHLLPLSLPSPGDTSPPEPPSHEWSKLLDANLEDIPVTDNARVNWLIAKAQSAEPRGSVGSGSSSPRGNYLAGMSWLTEALLIAEDEATRMRVYLEEIARLASMNRERRVAERLEAAGKAVAGPTIQEWRLQTESIAKARKTRQQARRLNARRAYYETLKRRRAQAVERNDDQSVERYDRLLADSPAQENER